MYNQKRKKLGELIIDAGLMSKDEFELALEKQKGSGKKIGEFLVEQGLVDENSLADILEFQLCIPKIDFNHIEINQEVPRIISKNLAEKHFAIPVNI